MLVYIVAIALFCLFFFAVISFRKKKPSAENNVFFKKYLPDPKRDPNIKIHKQIFDKSKIPQNLDVIIVGSGMSGLACASILAKDGKKVLVLEQHDKAGGFVNSFSRKSDSKNKYFFSPGVHYVNTVEKASFFHTLFDYVSDGGIKWEKLEPPFDVLNISGRARNIRYRDNFIKDLKKWYPKESSNITRFMSECRKVARDTTMIAIMRNSNVLIRSVLKKFGCGKTYLKYQKKPISIVTNEFFKDPDLRIIFSYMHALLGGYSHVPGSMVMACFYFYLKGAFIPKDGNNHIIKTIINVIEKYSCRVLCRANVKRIIVKNNCVEGVEVNNGIVIKAPIVISSCGVYNTYGSLLPKRFKSFVKTYEPELTSFIIYCGFSKTREELGFPKNNVHIIEQPNNYFKENWLQKAPTKDSVPPHYVFLSFLQQNNLSVCHIITHAKTSWFNQWKDLPLEKRGNDYEEYKEIITEKIMKVVRKYYPNLEKNIDYITSSSPLTYNHYINVKFGESYGLKNDEKRLFGKYAGAKTSVKGLYMTGVDTFISGGLTMAMMSSIVTCREIMKNKGFLNQAAERSKYLWKKKK